MKTIFPILSRELEEKHSSMLVTIVSEEGSSPRGAGSMMLVGDSGRFVGTIGGGAVEKRAEEEAERLLALHSSGMHEYCLRQNTAKNIGMVCGGNITVLFQLVSAEDALWKQIADGILTRIKYGQPGWLILRADGSAPTLLDDGKRYVAGKHMEKPEKMSVSDGIVFQNGIFSIPLPVESRAILFGGGHIALELAPILKNVGFRVVVFDDRPEFSNQERFPMAEQTVCGDYEAIESYLTLQEDDYVVVITEGHRHDYAVERQALGHKLAYIGAIGSKTKTASVNRQLLEHGFHEGDLKRLHAPIGMRIKAVTPEEIAVSIAGEMIDVRAARREAQTPGEHVCPMG